MFVYLQLLKESFYFAFKSLKDNKLRSCLSLLGVTVGIFSIISVLACVDSLTRNIRENLSGLDKNVLYLTKYSFGITDIPYWKRLSFPEVSYQEYEYLKKSVVNIELLGYSIFGIHSSIKYDAKIIPNIEANVASSEIEKIENIRIEKGRFYSQTESNSGASVIVLGHSVAKQLFENQDPIGKQIRYYEKKLTVIGVLKKYGAIIGLDEKVFVPANFIRRFVNSGPKGVPSAVIVKPKQGIETEKVVQALSQSIRTYRGLKPNEEDNFFINKVSSFTDSVDGIIGTLNLVGWVIGGFSVLVGGFGIANIMFVSVKERTHLIGIQKSLGAKNQFILFQFLFEAILLATIGGIFGLLLVWLAMCLATEMTDAIEFILSWQNVAIGVGVSVTIGIVSGILPAIRASLLNPVEAIRTGM